MLNRISEKFFWAGIISYFVYSWIYISQMGAVYNYTKLLYLSICLLVIKIILSKFSIVEFLVNFLIIIMAIICSYKIGDITYAMNFLILCSMKNMDFRKTIKLILFIITIVVSGLIVWVLLNDFESIITVRNFGRGMVETRFRFAWWHANRMHFVFFMLISLFLYCYNKKCRWWVYTFLIIFNVELLYLTRSRTGFICTLVTIILFMTLRYFPQIYKYKACLFAIFLIELGSIIGSLFSMVAIDLNYPVWRQLNQLTTGRIWIAHDWYNQVGIKWFGSAMDGLIPDLGVCRILLNYGIIVFIIFFILSLMATYILYKDKDYEMLLLLLVTMIYFTFEACTEAASDIRIFIIGCVLFKITGSIRRPNCGKISNK